MKEKQISIYLETNQYKKIKRLAQKDGRSMSDFCSRKLLDILKVKR